MTAPQPPPFLRVCAVFLLALALSGGSARAQFIWTGSGTLAAAMGSTTVAGGATLGVTSTSDHDFSATAWVNNGTVNWSGGRLRSGSGGTIVNNAAWNDTASGTTSTAINNDYGGPTLTFTNAASGNYTKTGTGQTNFYVPFINHGALALSEGTINLQGDGSFSSTGTASAAAGTTLYFYSNYSVADASKLTGTGDYILYGGTLDLTGVVGASGFKLHGGTLTNSQTFNSTVPWTATSLNSSGTTTIGTAGALTISGTNDHDFNSRAIVNNGIVNWTGGRLRSGNSGTILNNATWNDSATATTSYAINNDYGGTTLTYTNAATGTYTKSGAGQTNFYVPFINHGALVLSEGTINLQGGGNFSSTGTANAAAGTVLYFNSDYAVANGASLLGAGSYYLYGGTLTVSANLTASNFTLGGGTLAGTQGFNGGVTWTGTNLNSSGTTTNAAGSTFTVSGTNDHDFSSRAIVNNGTFNWTQGRLRSGNGGTFVNNGAFNDSASGTTSVAINSDYGGTPLVFTNSATGTYTKTGAGQTDFNNGAAFVNAGTLAVTAGTVNLAGGGSFAATGVATAAAGTTLYFNSNYTLTNGAALNGPGTYWLYNGTLTIDGPLSVGTFTQTNGTLAGAGSLSTGTFDFSGGSNAPAAFSLTAGNSTWTAGNMNGAGTTTVGRGATLAIGSSNSHDLSARSFVNQGVVNWSAGYIRGGEGGTITNAAGATFNDLNSSSYSIHTAYGGTFRFLNDGTYRRNAADTTSYLDIPFDNAGTVEVAAGDLQFRAGGSLAATGTISAAAGTNVFFTSGYSIADGTSLTGAGTYWLTAGTFDVTGAMRVGTFNQTGGTLAGTHVLNGVLNWSGGDWNAGALGPTTTLASGSILNLNGGSNKDINQRSVINRGTVNWNLGYIRGGNGSSFTNAEGATFNDLNPSSYSIHNAYGGTFRFLNNGTYRRNAADTTSYLDIPFDNAGTVEVAAGDLQFRAGGSLASTGTITAAVGTNVFFTAGYTIADGTSLAGAGSYWLTAGTFDVTGAMSVGTFNQTGGTLAGSHVLNGVINWSGGDWNAGTLGPTTTLASGSILNLNGGSNKDFNQRGVINRGTVNWNLGSLRGGNGASFTNAAGGTFNDLNPSGYSIHTGFGGSFVFTNNGTYNRNAAGTTSYIDTTFNNNGAVNVVAGDLQLRNGGTMSATGKIAAAADTNVFFTGGYAINNGASLTGDGTYWLTAGTMTLTGSINVGTFNQTGGSLNGSSTISGAFNWSGGDWNAGGSGFSTTIAKGATLNLTSGNNKDFDYRSIVNQGTVNWSLGYLRGGHGATFTNAVGAIFNDLNASGYSIHNAFGGDTVGFVNNGTYTRNVGGTTYLETAFDNNGTVNLMQGDIQVRQGGTMSATSVVNAATGTNFYLTNNYTLLDGAKFTGDGNIMQTGGTLTLDGNLRASAFNWSNGNWNASAPATTTIDSSTVLNLVSGNSKDFDVRNITNNGTVNWQLGYLRAGHGSVFTNATGGTFNDQNASGYTVHNPFGGTFTFVNNGTYVRNVGGTTYFDTPFNNSGVVNLQQGDIRIRQGGSMSATSVVNASTGTNFYFDNDYTFVAGAQLIGAGGFIQSGGTLSLTNLKASAFNWSGGNWNGAGTSTIDAGTVLNLVSGNSKDFDSRNIVNRGTVNWQLGYLRAGHGSIFTNAAGGTFNDQNASGYTVHNPFGGTFTFVNDGNYVRNVGGTTYYDTPFNNNGVVNLQQGDIQIRQGGTMSATSVVNSAAGTNLYFTNDYTLLSGSQFSGAGNVSQTGGTLTVETLKAAAFTWSSGNWNGAGTSIIDRGTTLNLASGNNKDFDSRTIINRGIVNWSAGYLRSGDGGSFINASGGVFNDLNTPGYTVHNPYGGSFTFVNDGLYSKATTGTTAFSVPFTNNGTLSITAGAVVFESTFTNSGAIALGSNATAQFSGNLSLGTSTLSGTGTITAPAVTAGGLVSPGNSPGQLTLTGNLTLLSTSSLLIELGGTTQGTNYDFLSVGGNATIAGTLQLAFVNGFQGSALPINTFTVLTAGGASGLTGAFANVPTSGLRINTIDGFGSFQVNFTPNSVVLSNFVAVPEPSTWAMLAAGGLLVVFQLRRRHSKD